jgi:hypothetical protein
MKTNWKQRLKTVLKIIVKLPIYVSLAAIVIVVGMLPSILTLGLVDAMTYVITGRVWIICNDGSVSDLFTDWLNKKLTWLID